MISDFRIKNFKSWEDTRKIRLGKLTGLFGANSSGKTGLLQFLLLLKQTVESQDRAQVLHTGNEQSYVDLGTFHDMMYEHALPGVLSFDLGWHAEEPVEIRNPLLDKGRVAGRSDKLRFETEVEATGSTIGIRSFIYHLDDLAFGMRRAEVPKTRKVEYELIHDGYEAWRTMGRKWPLPQPVKFYGFPDEAVAYYQNVGFLPDLALAFERAFQRTYYLGPLREYPGRDYTWAGERPQDVGRRGERAVAALLASREQGKIIQPGIRARLRTIEEHVAWWLQEIGVIYAFELRQIAPDRKLYEVRVKVSKESPWVLITDVGFGVSQILPVLVLCFYAPPGSTLILEQPEIHLHPQVQAGLADVFIDAIARRDIQIILESHSEHLLRRLQRRVAEQRIKAEEIALYFVEMTRGRSELRQLDVDMFGNIRNWPEEFFGDEMGELAAMTEAAVQRQQGIDGV